MSYKERVFSFLCSQLLLSEQLNSVLKWRENLCLCSVESNSHQKQLHFCWLQKPLQEQWKRRKLWGCYWFMWWKMNSVSITFHNGNPSDFVCAYLFRTTTQQWNAMLRYRCCLFTVHGKCVGGKTKLRISTEQGAVLLNRLHLPFLTLSQLSAHLKLWKCFQYAFLH